MTIRRKAADHSTEAFALHDAASKLRAAIATLRSIEQDHIAKDIIDIVRRLDTKRRRIMRTKA